MLGSNKYDGKLYSLKVRTKDKDKKECPPHFVVSAKEGDDWQEGISTTTSVSGSLSKVSFGSYEWKDDIVDTVSIYLTDEIDGEKEVYKIDFSYNILSKSIFNSFLNLPDEDGTIEISVYKNKGGYAAATVRLNDGIVGWKYTLEELPEAPAITFKGKEMRDYTEVDTFFREKLKEKFDGKTKQPSQQAAKKKVKEIIAETSGEGFDDSEDEIPF